ncbi:hypothetical protein IMZ31_18990 (plasmid) [Pontibacillus sp. ALD_SL1]|uniref:hypothetical protein n=1 Tax=Pontibacillus sp. ALD_SL1 TaxID=2777185 RepID=UPI001A95EC4A|nr:hypothetical protein [Pontibacillus sp. ALD_SL1]QST02636.1 hypothetical protein IMZ31_18990 [Pontibacillus sp. ALD_SL1]
MGICNRGTLHVIGPPQNILHFLREGFSNISAEDYVYHKEQDAYELVKQGDLAGMSLMWTENGSPGEVNLENYQPRHNIPALVYKRGSHLLRVELEGRGHLDHNDFSPLVDMSETFGLSIHLDFHDEDGQFMTMEADNGKTLFRHDWIGCWDDDCKGSCSKCKRVPAKIGFRSIS